jgi:hypothetical protein
VYETNFKEVERVLLGKVNVQLTVRLILRKAFAGIDNALTTQLLRLQDGCPTLFKRILSKSDQQALSLQLDDTSELEDVMDVEGVPDEGHVNPAVIARIASKDIQKIPHCVNDGRHLPVIPRTQCSQIFINLLRQAYGFDYNLSNMYTLTRGGLPMQWSKKFAFTDRYVGFSHVSSIFLRALAVILPLLTIHLLATGPFTDGTSQSAIMFGSMATKSAASMGFSHMFTTKNAGPSSFSPARYSAIFVMRFSTSLSLKTDLLSLSACPQSSPKVFM